MATLDNPNPTIFKPKKEVLSTSLWIGDDELDSSSGSSESSEDEVEAIDAAEIFGASLPSWPSD